MTVPETKIKTVKQVQKLLEEYPIIAIANLESMPTAQLTAMRKKLRGDVLIFMAKKRLVKLAFKNVKKEGMLQLNEYLVGMPALVLTKYNPFKLYAVLEKSKSKAPAKVGQVCPIDVIIPAGPTNFSPGPIISELASVGIKAGVEGGKIAIKQEKQVVAEGEILNEKQVGIMAKFDIKPMRIGINITAVLENGFIFTKDVLAIDEEEYFNNFCLAAGQAMNLSVEIGYITIENRETLLVKAFTEAKALAIEAGILTKDTVGDILGKAVAQMNALKVLVD